MAHVDFSLGDWKQFCLNHGLEDEDVAERLFEEMQNIGSSSALEVLMERVNNQLNADGVENIRAGYYYHVDRYYGDIVARYVNVGEPYRETLLLDTENTAFELTSHREWLETWEEEHVEREEPEEIVPTWAPGTAYPLIVMLRSIEGHEVAVHLWNAETMELAFSVPANKNPDEFFASSVTVGLRYAPREYSPYTWRVEKLVEKFEEQTSMGVTKFGPLNWQDDVEIELSQWERLRIALDAFMEAGMTRQPIKEFLVAPPVLWDCGDLEILWQDRSQLNDSVRVSAIARAQYGEVDEYGESEDSWAGVVWTAADSRLDELVETGDIKWKNDRLVREYLHQIGVCRSTRR